MRYPINEAPEILQRKGKTFLIYSASDTGTPDYALGMLTLDGGGVLNPNAWKKSPQACFFTEFQTRTAMFSVPDITGFSNRPTDSEDWIVYHGKESGEYTYRGRRSRAQKFSWNAEGTPEFRATGSGRKSVGKTVGRKVVRRRYFQYKIVKKGNNYENSKNNQHSDDRFSPRAIFCAAQEPAAKTAPAAPALTEVKEDFDGKTLDAAKWEQYSLSGGGKVKVADGKLITNGAGRFAWPVSALCRYSMRTNLPSARK